MSFRQTLLRLIIQRFVALCLDPNRAKCSPHAGAIQESRHHKASSQNSKITTAFLRKALEDTHTCSETSCYAHQKDSKNASWSTSSHTYLCCCANWCLLMVDPCSKRFMARQVMHSDGSFPGITLDCSQQILGPKFGGKLMQKGQRHHFIELQLHKSQATIYRISVFGCG